MGWQTSTTGGSKWVYNASEGGMTRSSSGASTTYSLWYVSTTKTFSPNKNYQFITTVDDFSNFDGSPTFSKFLEIETPWDATFSYIQNANPLYDSRPSLPIAEKVYMYSKPAAPKVSSDMVEYKSTYNGFGNPASDTFGIPTINGFEVVEFDWFIQGWSITSSSLNLGWEYATASESFKWKSNTTISSTRRYPAGTNNSGITQLGYTASNYITKLIEYPIFNISFDIAVSGSTTQSYVNMYLIDDIYLSSLKTTNTATFNSVLQNGQFLGKIEESGSYNFYNLIGDQYVLFVANYFESNATLTISNIIIEGSYQEIDNNEQFLFTNSGNYYEPTPLGVIGGSPDATYSVVVIGDDTLHNPTSSTFLGATGFPGFFSNLYGDVVNLNFLRAKVGNGTFKAGVWENGVWNSGWRVDTEVYEFDDIEISLLMETKNTRWRIKITGPQSSTSNFNIGDKVSIGNIVGIDINENRKLMKNYFTVLSVTTNSIIVDFVNTFPLRRIEKDSDNHKIKMTKNVWLNGGFLNGYFEGIWNAGLFKGFPYITEMYDSHWIDGKYDGGHFYGEYPEYTFYDTYYISGNQYTLGLTFSTQHGFKVGDLVYVDKTNKLLNPQYDGDATVVDVINDYLILLDKQFGSSTTAEGGQISRRTGTGVIQNFEFYDNNVGTNVTSVESTNLSLIYKYNSWIDVKYLTQSASNLGRSLVSYSPQYGEFSENNLYGYITNDVLSSISSFRNSHSLGKSIYSLGTKHKIYEDFLGEVSEFNEPFSTIPANGTMDNFYDNGWTFSIGLFGGTNSEINRKSDESIQIKLTDPFSILTLDNTNINISKKRYSVVEFDLTEYSTINDTFPINSLPSIYLLNNTNIPGLADPAFPISDYVYHALTNNIKKYEYFYNRRGLDILLLNLGGLTASFDNIKLYELDMIPFFQYTTEEYVNKSIQIPYQGIAPFIDYTDSDFSFIDNITIGLDSLSTEQSTEPPSGGGGNSGEGLFIL